MSNPVDEKLARSLTADSVDLLPELPYLLQDIWQLGGSEEMVLDLLRPLAAQKPLRILDLCCGKGAISLAMARELGATVRGVDLIPAFIEEARRRAVEQGIENRCTFTVADANISVMAERGYDVVVFSAAGDVLGDARETLAKLRGTVLPGGYILLDDSYLPPGAREANRSYLGLDSFLAIVAELGLEVVGKREAEEGELEEKNREDLKAIVRRAAELAERYPHKRALYRSYVESQRAEVDDLENSTLNLLHMLRVAEGG